MGVVGAGPQCQAAGMENSRVIELGGIHNFRDYGGYRTADGGQVKRGVLFRSGQHVDATPQDLDAIEALALRSIIDLRGNRERKSYPCRRPDNFDAKIVFYDGETAGLAPHEEAADGVLDPEAAHRAMENLYRVLPEREALVWVLREYFDVLSQGRGASLVHCLAGKDRTGMAVDLLHHALGVHPDDAMEDFLLTNTAGDMDARVAAGAKAVRARYGDMDDATVRVLMGVDERYLHASRGALVDRYGSVDAFLEQVLGVDEAKRNALRSHLLEG